MSKNKFTKTSVYILTEGETEYAHFSRIGEIVGNDIDWKYSVTVDVRKIVKGSKTDPINIVKEAKKAKKDFEIIWVVFDKDRERDEENRFALHLAEKSKINVAFSSISFEHWLILHFERNDFPFERSDCESRSTKMNPIICNCKGSICAKTYLKQDHLYPKFEKGKALIYDDFLTKNKTAIENAAWLREHQSPFKEIHTLHPYSDVDCLLTDLLNIDKVEYVTIGKSYLFEGVLISVLDINRKGNNIKISLHLDNQRKSSFPINNNQEFCLIDNQGNIFQYNDIQSSILFPNSAQNITLEFTVYPNSESIRFKSTTLGKYILVDIPD